MAKAPDYVRAFIKGIPEVWDDTKYVDGYPGKFVVLVRQGGGRWYLAGINGETTEKKLTLDLSQLRVRSGTLITDSDGGNLPSARKRFVFHSTKTWKSLCRHMAAW